MLIGWFLPLLGDGVTVSRGSDILRGCPCLLLSIVPQGSDISKHLTKAALTKDTLTKGTLP